MGNAVPDVNGPAATGTPFAGRATAPTWTPPTPLGYPASIQALGGFAAPLLAATSFTMIALLLSSPLQSFARWPNAALTLLLLAGLAQIAVVQATMWTRRYDTSPAELAAWYPQEITGGTPSDWLRNLQVGHAELNERWANRTRFIYHVGIVMLLAGLVATVVPARHISTPRWILIFTAAAGLAGEIFWIVAASSFDPVRRRTGLHRTGFALLWAMVVTVAATADSTGARLLVVAPAGVLIIAYLAPAVLPVARGRGALRISPVDLAGAVIAAVFAALFVLAAATWSAWTLAVAAVVCGAGEVVRSAVALRPGTDKSAVATSAG
ncbi:hypothetical protein [Paractinoplanes globisporus]|uniref:Uncharacterized protein n=1 Tax=Paractinoplanes globisporus TaxID=113565 RepID=A0ABW6WIF3_9ACTN|nr:hypothetical protein [Actinoplanes globisporus]